MNLDSYNLPDNSVNFVGPVRVELTEVNCTRGNNSVLHLISSSICSLCDSHWQKHQLGHTASGCMYNNFPDADYCFFCWSSCSNQVHKFSSNFMASLYKLQTHKKTEVKYWFHIDPCKIAVDQHVYNMFCVELVFVITSVVTWIIWIFCSFPCSLMLLFHVRGAAVWPHYKKKYSLMNTAKRQTVHTLTKLISLSCSYGYHMKSFYSAHNQTHHHQCN